MGKRSVLPNYFKQNSSHFSSVKNAFFSFFKKLWILGITIVLLAGLGSAVYLSQQQTNLQQHASGNAWEGNAVYDSCGTGCLSHLDQFHNEGFFAVMDYIIFGWTNPSAIQAYAQHAQQDNIKIIWSLKDFYTARGGANPGSSAEYKWVTSACGCNDWNSAARYLVNLVKNDPATWGYYIADEPSSYNHPLSVATVASLSNTVHNADPNHPRLLINDDSLDHNSAAAASNLASYAGSNAGNIEVVGEDFYPVSYRLNINIVKDIMNEVQYVANSYGKKSAIVLEVNSGNSSSDWCHATSYPSVSQMESMYSQVLKGYSSNNPSLVLWYWYPCTSSSQWNNLLTAIQAVTGPMVPPTATSVPPTQVPPTATSVPPTATRVPPTATPRPTSIPTKKPEIPSPTNSPTSTPTSSPRIPEDVNGDGKVNVIDYELLVACYGSKFHTSSCIAGSKADINGDGIVDGIDYNIWLRAFLSEEKQ